MDSKYLPLVTYHVQSSWYLDHYIIKVAIDISMTFTKTNRMYNHDLGMNYILPIHPWPLYNL